MASDATTEIARLLGRDPICNGRVTMDTVEAIAALVADATAIERERCATAFEQVIAGGYDQETEQCQHGRYRFEDCIACYDEALLSVTAAIRKGPTP